MLEILQSHKVILLLNEVIKNEAAKLASMP